MFGPRCPHTTLLCDVVATTMADQLGHPDLIYAPRRWIAAPGTLAKSDSAGLSASRDLLDHAHKLLWHCGAQHDRVPAAASEEQTNAPRPRLATRSRRAFRRARGLVSSVGLANAALFVCVCRVERHTGGVSSLVHDCAGNAGTGALLRARWVPNTRPRRRSSWGDTAKNITAQANT